MTANRPSADGVAKPGRGGRIEGPKLHHVHAVTSARVSDVAGELAGDLATERFDA